MGQKAINVSRPGFWDDTAPHSLHTNSEPLQERTMPHVTRLELEAKLSATEERMNARVASIESKIDTFLAVQAERDKSTEARFAGIEREAASTREDIKSLKRTVVVTAISVVLTILFSIAGFNAALTSNMLSAFQIGLTTPAAEAQAAPPAPSK